MQGRRTITLALTGAIDGDKMSGTLQPQGGERENRSWSAVRQQGKSGRSEPAQNQDEDDEYGL
jgi:hypothetical protein